MDRECIVKIEKGEIDITSSSKFPEELHDRIVAACLEWEKELHKQK